MRIIQETTSINFNRKMTAEVVDIKGPKRVINGKYLLKIINKNG